jgi:hypothetical protein
MQEPGENPDVQDSDTDADAATLNPRDLRGEESGDGARAAEDGSDADADPGSLNPRTEQG